eukprot:symbB.v1.2.004056.t1/scaffold228.1/size260974/25
MCCHVLPIRCCYLLPLVLLSAINLMFQAVADSCGTFPGLAWQPRALRIVLSLAILASSFSTAYRVEKMNRKCWVQAHARDHDLRASSGHKEMVKAALDRDLKVFRSCGCSLVFGVRQDFQICCGSLKAAETFFGMDLLGQSFLPLLLDVDADRFTRLCKEVEGSRIPRSLPITLLVMGRLKPARLIVFHHGRAGKEFLLGIKLSNLQEGLVDREHSEPDVGSPMRSHPFAPESLEYRLASASDPDTLVSSTPNHAMDSLCYTASAELPMEEAECSVGTQTCGTLPLDLRERNNKSVETRIAWRPKAPNGLAGPGGRFRCRNCQRPPQLPGPIVAAEMEEKMAESLVGTWILQPQFDQIAQEFIKRLVIFPDGTCIDALGLQREVKKDDMGNFFLLKGHLWTSGDKLFREGRSGITMCFDREAEHAILLADDMEEEEEEEVVDDQEADSLFVLENMVGGGHFLS